MSSWMFLELVTLSLSLWNSVVLLMFNISDVSFFFLFLFSCTTLFNLQFASLDCFISLISNWEGMEEFLIGVWMLSYSANCLFTVLNYEPLIKVGNTPKTLEFLVIFKRGSTCFFLFLIFYSFFYVHCQYIDIFPFLFSHMSHLSHLLLSCFA